jgi:hypothetical protein
LDVAFPSPYRERVAPKAPGEGQSGALDVAFPSPYRERVAPKAPGEGRSNASLHPRGRHRPQPPPYPHSPTKLDTAPNVSTSATYLAPSSDSIRVNPNLSYKSATCAFFAVATYSPTTRP